MELTKDKFTLLAEGANSEVFLYHQGDLQAVLKIVHSSSKEAKHLSNEYTTLKKLEHQNIILPLKYSEKIEIKNSVGQKSVRNILVLEKASHGNLLTVIKNAHFTVPQIRCLFTQLCQAVQYLHCNYIVHRDLKLENVLVTDEKGRKVIKLADFGFADPFMTNEKIIFFSHYKGTKKAYMAPEIHEILKNPKQMYDAQKCDTFALGVILFTMMFKKYPFEYATKDDTIYKLIVEEKYDSFWKHHAKSILQFEQRQYSMVQDFKTLFISMVRYVPKERASIFAVLESDWMSGMTSEVTRL